MVSNLTSCASALAGRCPRHPRVNPEQILLGEGGKTTEWNGNGKSSGKVASFLDHGRMFDNPTFQAKSSRGPDAQNAVLLVRRLMPWEPEGVVEERLASFSCDDKTPASPGTSLCGGGLIGPRRGPREGNPRREGPTKANWR